MPAGGKPCAEVDVEHEVRVGDLSGVGGAVDEGLVEVPARPAGANGGQGGEVCNVRGVARGAANGIEGESFIGGETSKPRLQAQWRIPDLNCLQIDHRRRSETPHDHHTSGVLELKAEG